MTHQNVCDEVCPEWDEAYSDKSLHNLVVCLLLCICVIAQHAQSHLRRLLRFVISRIEFVGRCVFLIHDNFKMVAQVDVFCSFQQVDRVITELYGSLTRSNYVTMPNQPYETNKRLCKVDNKK